MSVLSIEFFPPKTPEGAQKLREVRQTLYALKPSFCSVTYGAGGATQAGTFATVQEILNEGVEAAAHFSCIGASRQKVLSELSELKAMGVKRLVALRGDLPSGYGLGGEFQHASDLVRFIRQEMGDAFHIEVAAYPEFHPQSGSVQSDIKALLEKERAGADCAITQYFFNQDAYFRYCDDARAMGVSLPIIPGIMPILNASQLIRFSEACGAEIPRWIKHRLQSFGDDVNSIKAFGVDVISRLCEQMIQGGAPGLHFYSMNQSVAVMQICQNLKLA